MKTHDYRNGGWGHDIIIHTVIDKGLLLKVQGFGYGVAVGDYIRLAYRDSTNGETKYKVDKIAYYSNPRDMWTAELSWAPRPEPI